MDFAVRCSRKAVKLNHSLTHSIIGLPPIGLAFPMHRLHLKLVSDFRGPEMPLHFLWIQLEQPPLKMDFAPTPLRQRPLGPLPDFWSTSSLGPDIRILVLPMLTQSPFPSMLVFQRISFWWPGHLHTGFLRDILCEILGRGLPEPWWTVRGSSKSLGVNPLSHWTHHSGCSQHILCFWHFHTCSVWAAPATPHAEFVKSPPDDTSWYTIKSLFQIDEGHVQCLVDGIKLFLQLAYNEYGVCGAASRHEAKLHVVNAHLL